MDEIMTVKEVAAFLKTHPSTIYKKLKYENFPGFRIGTDWRFRLSAIEAWMDAQTTKEVE